MVVWLWKKVADNPSVLAGYFCNSPTNTCFERAMEYLQIHAAPGESYVLEVTKQADPSKTIDRITYQHA